MDANFPANLMDFQDRFGSETKCVAYLFSKRYPQGFRCPRCACRKGSKISKGVLIECDSCEHQASLTAGTMFYGTRKPITMWLRANFEFVSRKNGCNAMDLQRLFGLCRKFAWAWLHKIRDVMVHADQKLLVGVEEIDETHAGGSEEGVHGRSRGSKNHLVLGTVEVVTHEGGGAACGRTRLDMVPSGSAEDLQTCVASNVKEGARAHTDGWRGYDSLESNYDHHREVISDPKRASTKFPHIHRVFSLPKRVLPGTYQQSVSSKHLSTNCNEFAFRFNRRTSGARTLLCQRILENALLRKPRVHRFAEKAAIWPLAT